MRAVTHNDYVDLHIYIPCNKMRKMNANVIIENITSVLNSTGDTFMHSLCIIDIGGIKYPRRGKARNFVSLSEKIAYNDSSSVLETQTIYV